MKTACISLLCLAFLASGCSDQPIEADFQPLSGNQFILEVDRVAEHPVVQSPSDLLDEKDFSSVSLELEYEVTFSKDQKSVFIESSTLSEPVSGTLSEETEAYKSYNLTEGLFAGGRLIIWVTGTAFQAEYTVYGSGIPIIRSERGFLNPSK